MNRPLLTAVAALALLAALPATAQRTGDATDAPLSALVAQAVALEHGEGVGKDLAKAAALYCTAARNGDAEGLFGLGWMYANGRGVARDDAVAGSLFSRAAELGHGHSQRLLALFPGRAGALPDCLTLALPVAAASPVATTPEPSPVAGAAGADPFAQLPPHKRRIADMVSMVAPAFAVEPRLALAVIAAESNFEPGARSPKDARGLMQLIPETASRFNVRNAFDPQDNVRGGLRYLRWLLAYYQGQVPLVLAAYNAGEGAVDRYRGVPPFPETREYVERVMQLFRRAWHPYDPKIVGPSRALGAGAAPPRVQGTLPPLHHPTRLASSR